MFSNGSMVCITNDKLNGDVSNVLNGRDCLPSGIVPIHDGS